MINLLNKKEEEDATIAKVRGIVKSVTTAALVVYLVTMSGILGWQLWFSSKEKKISEEFQSLNWQVKNKASEEVISRRMANRIKAVNDFIVGRGSSSEAAGLILNEEASVSAWSYSLGGKQTVRISGAGPWELSRYAQIIASYYSDVRFETVDFSKGNWTANMLFQDRRKK
jgi:hypothetical protein